jgi:hypothetical protein
MLLSKRCFPLQNTMSPSTLRENGAFSSACEFSHHLLLASHLTTHPTESLGIPTLSSTSDSLALLNLIAASLSFRNSSRMVTHLSLVILYILSYPTRRQPPPIYPRRIQAAAMASPSFFCHRHCPCPRLPSCPQMYSSRPQGREPPRHRERSSQDHRFWFCPHRSP